MHSTGSALKRIIAADSPPRICGPADRVIKPWKPLSAAASSKMRPVVTAPLPPEPVTATEKLVLIVSDGIFFMQTNPELFYYKSLF
jgi:hypothetical protein